MGLLAKTEGGSIVMMELGEYYLEISPVNGGRSFPLGDGEV